MVSVQSILASLVFVAKAMTSKQASTVEAVPTSPWLRGKMLCPARNERSALAGVLWSGGCGALCGRPLPKCFQLVNSGRHLCCISEKIVGQPATCREAIAVGVGTAMHAARRILILTLLNARVRL